MSCICNTEHVKTNIWDTSALLKLFVVGASVSAFVCFICLYNKYAIHTYTYTYICTHTLAGRISRIFEGKLSECTHRMEEIGDTLTGQNDVLHAAQRYVFA
jgi:hypothetical protein